MPETRTRAPVPGAALARMLARMTGLDAAPPAQSPADRLGDWLEWQRAVALSRVLDGGVADGSAATDGAIGAGAADPGAADRDEALAAECRALRAALEDAIADESRDWTRPLRPRASEDGDPAAAGAAAVLRHCQGLQRDLQAATGRLRGELRERLELRGGDQAGLAGIDAVMEGMLAPREHALLAPVVPALVARFEHLHARGDAGDGAWRAGFRREAGQALLAELDLRFQPIEALLAALRSPRPDA